MNKLYDAIGVLCLAIVLTPIIVLGPALPLAIFASVTGIAIAPWVASAIAFPLSVYIARNALSL